MSSIGQGSISVSQRTIPAGPPFPGNSADNGLSIDPITGKIVLGNDAGLTTAALLSNREIPVDGFTFSLVAGGVPIFLVDEPGLRITAGTQNGNMLDLQEASLYRIGDLNSAGNDTVLGINDLNGGLIFSTGAGTILELDQSTGIYRFGDLSNAANGNAFEVDDVNSFFKIKNIALNAAVEINNVPGFTGTVAAPATITVIGGIVTNVA